MLPKKLGVMLAVVLAHILCAPSAQAAEAQRTITENQLGVHDGYDYELWKDAGTTSMVLNDGGTFSCTWSDINNALFRKGMKFDETKTHDQLGNISITYECDYNPKGNSYMCVYGWTSDPLVEYYIIDSWGNWRPPGAISKGTITVDGGTYDIYETTRTDQPSIKGTATFQQYWSVRTEKRSSGTISVSEHLKAWESIGMKLGNMYEAALLIEGYQSSGTAEVLSNTITVGGEGTGQTAVVNVLSPDIEILKGTAAFGTPSIDGAEDAVWNQTETLPIDQMLQTQDSASGTAQVLWDNDNLYVLFKVKAETLDNTSENAHERSSVEAFFDESNCKLGAYAADDGQYRVCYDGGQSFGGSTNTEGFESAAAVNGSDYVVEMKIPFRTLKPEADMKIGFDAQINDAKDGVRTGVAKWSDPSDNSWQDTTNWGILTLTAPDTNAQAAVPENTADVAESTNDTSATSKTVALGSILTGIFSLIVVAGITAAVILRRRRK